MAKKSKEVRKYLASLGRKGGKARTQQMTAAERKALARKAAQARWGKRKAAEEILRAKPKR
jgi:phage gp16-like protein